MALAGRLAGGQHNEPVCWAKHEMPDRKDGCAGRGWFAGACSVFDAGREWGLMQLQWPQAGRVEVGAGAVKGENDRGLQMQPPVFWSCPCQ